MLTNSDTGVRAMGNEQLLAIMGGDSNTNWKTPRFTLNATFCSKGLTAVKIDGIDGESLAVQQNIRTRRLR